MRVAGIIAEYNPFHNGHLHHLKRTRAITGCDYVVVAMAGSFTQRGEPALTDKWSRARAALMCGADLVVELPALFAVRSAQGFAQGGVALLGALGLVDDLSFGCELDDMHALTGMAALLRDEPPQFKALLRAGLDKGMSHPRARGEALCRTLGIDPAVAAAPNTALALEYVMKNWTLARPMRPVLVHRAVGYHDLRMGQIASASAIRAAVARGEGVDGAVPVKLTGGLCPANALDDMLLYRVRGMDGQALGQLPDMPEGLESRIAHMAQRATSREQLIALVKCKRYTRARISRALCHALLGMDGALCRAYPAPGYARVLGFRDDARPLLRAIQRVSAIALVTDPTKLKADECFALERRATDLWGLGTNHEPYRRAGRDLTERVVIV